MENDDIETRIEELRKKFANVSTETLQWLKRKFPDDAVAALHWVNQILKVSQDEPPAIDGTVENYSELSELLLKNLSYTCPEFLRQLLRLSDNQHLKDLMDDYMTSFKEFCCNFVPLKQTQFEPYDPHMPCLILIFESDTTLQIVEAFVKDVFGIYNRYLVIYMAEVGSVKVILQFPASIEHFLQKCIDLYKKQAVQQTKVAIHREPPISIMRSWER